jgi:hypothetical protein
LLSARGLKKRVVNNLTLAGIKAGHEAIMNNARTAKQVVQTVDQIKAKRQAGKSYREIASCLNAKGNLNNRFFPPCSTLAYIIV